MTGGKKVSMSSTLTRDPLLVAFSYRDGHVIEPDFAPTTDGAAQPLGYLYSQWDGTVATPMWGEFDPTTQTWNSPDDVLTMGVATYTTTYCYSTDRCFDGSCG